MDVGRISAEACFEVEGENINKVVSEGLYSYPS